MTTSPSRVATGPTIRQAERADLLAIYRIEQAVFPQPWPFDAFERYLGSAGFMVAVGEGILGYVVADTVPNHGRPLGHIKDVAVHPDFQRRGLGRRLVRRALGVLDAEGASSVKLEVRASNEAAISLYRDLGFVHRRTIPRYYSDGEDAFVLLAER
ncbi:MAG: ribosomal protein S18-alanine N-acetyltransferase [Salinirussus sp.]